VKSDEKRITEALIKEMIRTAGEISRRPGHWWCDQLNNHDAVAAYAPLGDEIWDQTNGHIDAFVHAVSTAHSIHGVTQALWKRNPRIEVTAVEPAESAVLSGKPSGSHKIEGIGIGFIPPLWDASLVNRIEAVSTEDAKQWRAGWRARKVYSLERRLAQTWQPRCASPTGSAPARPSSRLLSIQACGM
jgi:cysteine synthase A